MRRTRINLQLSAAIGVQSGEKCERLQLACALTPIAGRAYNEAGTRLLYQNILAYANHRKNSIGAPTRIRDGSHLSWPDGSRVDLAPADRQPHELGDPHLWYISQLYTQRRDSFTCSSAADHALHDHVSDRRGPAHALL